MQQSAAGIRTVAIIGAGRVAWSLASAIVDAGYGLVHICSQHLESCSSLGEKLGVPYSTNKADIGQADLYICCVKDDAIVDAAKDIDFGNGILVHTAGSIDMDVLKPLAKNYGVLYPMQSFSKQRKVDFSTLPFYVEACNDECSKVLCDFAESLGSRVYRCNSLQRRKLHVSAVFASNFVNHMYSIADKILTQAGLNFEHLLPLIDETAAKVHELRPLEAQTGPAARHDEKTLMAHMQCLSGNELELYRQLSESIQRMQDEKF